MKRYVVFMIVNGQPLIRSSVPYVIRNFADKHLFDHEKSQHNTNQSRSGEQHDNALPLQDGYAISPGQSAWINPNRTHDESLKTVYEGEKEKRLVPSLTNTFPCIFNLPFKDLVSLDKIIDFINQIRFNENQHCKLNFDFGLFFDDLERDRVR